MLGRNWRQLHPDKKRKYADAAAAMKADVAGESMERPKRLRGQIIHGEVASAPQTILPLSRQTQYNLEMLHCLQAFNGQLNDFGLPR